MFLQYSSTELDNHLIHPDWHLTSDYAPLLVTISITEENINSQKRTIIKDSEEKESFVKEVIAFFKNINTSNLLDIPHLKKIVNDFANIIDNAWEKNSKIVNITRYSKSWWDENCNWDLEKYGLLKSIEDWKAFRMTIKNTKWSFFDLKIQEIANKKQGPWELMSWVNKHKLLVIETIKYNSQPCLDLNDLWQALHSSFNTAQFYHIDENVLNKLGLYTLLS